MVADHGDLAMVNDRLDDLGQAMLSITGRGDRLRMHCLLAYVNWRPTKAGASFTWEGAWEYDPMRGTGGSNLHSDFLSVRLSDAGTQVCSSPATASGSNLHFT